MSTNTPDAQMRNEFIELADDVAQVVNEHRQVNVNASDVQAFLELLERTATQVRDMQYAVITRNIDRHLAEQAATEEDNAGLEDEPLGPLAPPLEDMLLFDYGTMELHFRRSDGCYVITSPRRDRMVFGSDALDEACNAFADHAGCSPVAVLEQAVARTEGA